MKSKVGRLTQVLYEEGKGDVQETAKVFSNFVSQLVVQPFVAPTNKTVQHIKKKKWGAWRHLNTALATEAL